MTDIVELEVVLNRLGVESDAAEADDVARLLDAVGTSIRRRTRRGFEGEPTTYTETYRVRGADHFVLRHVPVASITDISRVRFDGTVETAWASTYYRLEDATRGLIRLLYRAEYAQVTYVVTGEIQADVQEAAEEWIATRWVERGREGLASYQTGGDAESYFASLAGQPPKEVSRVLASYYHSTGGGAV